MKSRSIKNIATAGDTVEKMNEYLDQCTERMGALAEEHPEPN
jgi:hypothetical protein